MSFGFGIGDILACIEVAVKTTNALRSAGPEFEGLRLEVSSLISVLEGLEAEARGPMPLIHNAPRDRQEQMCALLGNCRSGMKDLQNLIDKYGSMGDNRKRDFIEWMKFAASDKRSPRDKLAIHTASINIFLTTLSHGSLARLEFLIKNGRRETSEAATPSTGQRDINLWSTAVPDPTIKPTTKSVWQSIIKSLAEEGIEDEQVDNFQEEVKAYVRYLVRGETPFWKNHQRVGEKAELSESVTTTPAPDEPSEEKEKKRNRLRSELEKARRILWPPPWAHGVRMTGFGAGPSGPPPKISILSLNRHKKRVPTPPIVSSPSPGMDMSPESTWSSRRPLTYTRMSRKHLSIEALRAKAIEFEVDKNPDYLIIKRWVPPDEQNELWSLTRIIREDREKPTVTLAIEDRHRRRRRRRSKKPAWFMTHSSDEDSTTEPDEDDVAFGSVGADSSTGDGFSPMDSNVHGQSGGGGGGGAAAVYESGNADAEGEDNLNDADAPEDEDEILTLIEQFENLFELDEQLKVGYASRPQGSRS